MFKNKKNYTNFVKFLSNIAREKDTDKSSRLAKNFLDVLNNRAGKVAMCFGKNDFSVADFANELKDDGFAMDNFVSKWDLLEKSF